MDYRVAFGGDLAEQNITLMRSGQHSPGVTVVGGTLVDGQGGAGPRYLFDPASLAGSHSFNLELTVNGQVHSIEGLPVDITETLLAQRVGDALTATTEAVDEVQSLTLKMWRSRGRFGRPTLTGSWARSE